MPARLVIGGLAPAVGVDDVTGMLQAYGDARDVAVVEKGGSRIAFVTCEDEKAVMGALHHTSWKGRKLQVGVAKPDHVARRAQDAADEVQRLIRLARKAKRKRGRLNRLARAWEDRAFKPCPQFRGVRVCFADDGATVAETVDAGALIEERGYTAPRPRRGKGPAAPEEPPRELTYEDLEAPDAADPDAPAADLKAMALDVLADVLPEEDREFATRQATAEEKEEVMFFARFSHPRRFNPKAADASSFVLFEAADDEKVAAAEAAAKADAKKREISVAVSSLKSFFTPDAKEASFSLFGGGGGGGGDDEDEEQEQEDDGEQEEQEQAVDGDGDTIMLQADADNETARRRRVAESLQDVMKKRLQLGDRRPDERRSLDGPRFRLSTLGSPTAQGGGSSFMRPADSKAMLSDWRQHKAKLKSDFRKKANRDRRRSGPR